MFTRISRSAPTTTQSHFRPAVSGRDKAPAEPSMVDWTASRPAYDFTRIPLLAAAPPVIQLGKTKKNKKKEKLAAKKKQSQSKKIVESESDSESDSEEEKEKKVATPQPKPQITPVIEPEVPRSRKAQRQQRQHAEVELEKQKQALENPKLEAEEKQKEPEESPATRLHNWVIDELNEIDPDPDVLEYLKNEPEFKKFIALEAEGPESSSESEESKVEEIKAEQSKAEESSVEERKSPIETREERLRKEAYNRYYQARREFKSRPSGVGGGGSDWASKATRRRAKELSEAHVEADPSFPVFPGKEKRESTLDHKVSQHNLKVIDDAAKKTGNRARLAAALGAESEDQVKKKLLNLPANLELGPPGQIRTGDPGSGFDPNRTSSGSLTPRSESLSHIDRMAESRNFDWKDLATRLERLSKQKELTPPVTSQWKKQGSKFVRDVPRKEEEIKLGLKKSLKAKKGEKIQDSDSEESEIAEPSEFKKYPKSEFKQAPEKITLQSLTPTTKASSPTLKPLDFSKAPSISGGSFKKPFEFKEKPAEVTLRPSLERSTPTNKSNQGKAPLLSPRNPSRGGPGATPRGGSNYGSPQPSGLSTPTSPWASLDEGKLPPIHPSNKSTITEDSDDDAELEEALYRSTLETSGRGGGSSRGRGYARGGSNYGSPQPPRLSTPSSPWGSLGEGKLPPIHPSNKSTITEDSDDDAELEEALRRSLHDTGGFEGGGIELKRKESRELSPHRQRLEPRERARVSTPKLVSKPKIVGTPSTVSLQSTAPKTTPPNPQPAPRERSPRRLTSPRNRTPNTRGGTWQKKRRDSEDEEKF